MAFIAMDTNGVSSQFIENLKKGDSFIIQDINTRYTKWFDPYEFIVEKSNKREPSDDEWESDYYDIYDINGLHIVIFIPLINPDCKEYLIFKDWPRFIKYYDDKATSSKDTLNALQLFLKSYKTFRTNIERNNPEYLI